MLITEATTEEHFERLRRIDGWAEDQWRHTFSIVTQMENHAITYLMTTNGGAAAGVIAFVGSSGFTHWAALTALAIFVIGVLLCGFLIAHGYHSMSNALDALNTNYQKFRDAELRSGEMIDKHTKRFEEAVWGVYLGWGSFIALMAGIALSMVAFSAHLDAKAEAKKEEAIKAAKVQQQPAPPPPTPAAPSAAPR